MVDKKKIMIFGLLLLAAAAGVWFFFFRETEESIIKGRFQALSEVVRKKPGEGNIRAVAVSQGIGNFFTEEVSIDVDGLAWLNGTYSRELIESNTFRARQMFRTLSLTFDDITLEISGDRAEVFFTATFYGVPKNGDPVREIRELEAVLKKTDGKWQFESFRIQNIIKK